MQIPQRPRLAVGVRVLRHGPDQWQVGLEPEHRLRLPDTESVRRTLHGLSEAALAGDGDPVVLSALAAHGLLLREPAALSVPPPRRVAVQTYGAGELPDVAAVARRAGLDPVRVDTVDAAGLDVGLLVGFGEPDRALADPWVYAGLPHLVVRMRAEAVVVGPLVVPGDGACLRCLDAHRTQDDPRWPQLVHRHAELDRAPRRDGVRDRPDEVLATLALAWAARDLATHLAGRQASTRSATLRLPLDLADLELTSWSQHSECACTW